MSAKKPAQPRPTDSELAVGQSEKTLLTELAKLGLKEAPEDNRRVLAVLKYLRR